MLCTKYFRTFDADGIQSIRRPHHPSEGTKCMVPARRFHPDCAVVSITWKKFIQPSRIAARAGNCPLCMCLAPHPRLHPWRRTRSDSRSLQQLWSGHGAACAGPAERPHTEQDCQPGGQDPRPRSKGHQWLTVGGVASSVAAPNCERRDERDNRGSSPQPRSCCRLVIALRAGGHWRASGDRVPVI
jgi:hypothetical protein